MGAPVTSTPVTAAGHSTQLPAAATLCALGVVYGDIGTSPLYALREAAKAATHGGPLTNEAVLGVVSLILWALILIISIKYALLILRADNRGEGGIVALLALLHARHAPAEHGARNCWWSALSAPPCSMVTARLRLPSRCSAPSKA
jgi:KUP system potassium uptake protein